MIADSPDKMTNMVAPAAQDPHGKVVVVDLRDDDSSSTDGDALHESLFGGTSPRPSPPSDEAFAQYPELALAETNLPEDPVTLSDFVLPGDSDTEPDDSKHMALVMLNRAKNMHQAAQQVENTLAHHLKGANGNVQIKPFDAKKHKELATDAA